jgi:hypothetical protein
MDEQDNERAISPLIHEDSGAAGGHFRYPFQQTELG